MGENANYIKKNSFPTTLFVTELEHTAKHTKLNVVNSTNGLFHNTFHDISFDSYNVCGSTREKKKLIGNFFSARIIE